MATTKKTGIDSKGREWQVSKDEYGLPVLTPIGHDTQADSADLSMEDEGRLCDLVADASPDLDGFSAEDAFYLGCDRSRDADEEVRMVA